LKNVQIELPFFKKADKLAPKKVEIACNSRQKGAETKSYVTFGSAPYMYVNE
jgi:hypothetical protein